MQIHIVERQHFEDTTVEGVFSTFDKAEAFCLKKFRKLYEAPLQNDYVGIYSMELDKEEMNLRACLDHQDQPYGQRGCVACVEACNENDQDSKSTS